MAEGSSSSSAAAAITQKLNQIPGFEEYTAEVKEITEMLEALRQELASKEERLGMVERELETAGKILEERAQLIVDKDAELKKIEEALVNKEKEMKLQEGELQLHAALEYLSFRTREEELLEREKKVVIKEDELNKMLDARIGKLKDELEAKTREIEKLTAKLKLLEGKAPGVMPEDIGIKVDELKRKEEELDVLRTDLMGLETRLREYEEDLRHREEKLRKQERRLPKGVSKKDPKLKEKEKALVKREEELERLREELEYTLHELKDREHDLKLREDELEELKQKLLRDAGAPQAAIDKLIATDREIQYAIRKEVKKKEEEIKARMRREAEHRIKPLLRKIDLLERRNEELESTREALEEKELQLAMKEDELKERYDEITYNEQRLIKREEKLIKERMIVEREKMALKERKGEGKAEELLAEKLRIKSKELKELEAKLKEKEEFLKRKEADMRALEERVIEEDLKMEEAIEREAEVNKVKTGVRRLDDLLYGGLPFNSNVLLYGPPFTGKLVLLNNFVAEGLKKGIPAIYILTDKTPSEIRELLEAVLPNVKVYEQKGLIRYVDAYSKSMGIDVKEPNTIYVDNPTNLDAINLAVEGAHKAFSNKYKYHKLVFHSLSTLMAYTDPMTIFRFLQNFTSKSKRANGVSLLCMDAGISDPSAVMGLKHLMTGVIEFKIEDLKTYLRVEGLGQVRTQAWIQYTHSTKGLALKGAFEVEHIR